MKFKYNKEVSKILDYLIFPRIYFNLEEELQDREDSLGNIIKEDYKELIKEMHILLDPYKDEINQFYQKDIYSNYDFSNIVIQAYPIYDYANVHDYLNDLLKEKPEDFKEKIIKALVTMEDENDDLSEFDESDATKYINQLKIDSANKWNLFMMVQNSKQHLEQFIMLLKKIDPFFETTFKKYEETYDKVGKDLARRLSKNTNETFREITYDAISYDFGDGETCNFYVSFVMPYSLRLFNSDIHRIIWGLEMEYSLRRLHELNEDKLAQRVKIFKALGDKTRYEALKLIAKGVKSIKNIADELDVSSATISYHINEFLNSGILYLNKQKNQKFGYRVDYDKLNEVFADLKEDLNFVKQEE